MTKSKKDKDCQCQECQSACSFKPGWFKPNEVEKVAKYLDVPLKKLFKEKLMVDWWENYPNNIFLLSPAVVNGLPGKEFPTNPKGRCVFFKDGKCEIHEVKPFECRKVLHKDTPPNLHHDVAFAWDKPKHQKQIKDLLGREPTTEEYSLKEALLDWEYYS